jgi:hypothetical protein
MVTSEQEKKNRHAFMQFRVHEADEEAMAKIFHDHPELVQFETEYLKAIENAKNNEEEEDVVAAATKAGPSTIDLLSGSSSELDSDSQNKLNCSDDDEWERTPPPPSMFMYHSSFMAGQSIKVSKFRVQV